MNTDHLKAALDRAKEHRRNDGNEMGSDFHSGVCNALGGALRAARVEELAREDAEFWKRATRGLS